MSRFYLRHVSGEKMGPFPQRTLEVLFDARVVDETTPISSDGGQFKNLGEWSTLHAHLLEIKEALGRGENPWPQDASEAQPLLKKMLDLGIERTSGYLDLQNEEGEIRITFKEGKIVQLATTADSMDLGDYLVNAGLCDAAGLQQAKAQAPAMGGDIGGAMIALGLVQPHVYFEKFIDWATETLGRALVVDWSSIKFELDVVQNPPVPLGFDRFGIYMNLLRKGTPKASIKERLENKRACPLIMSQVEGLETDVLKLKPRELRVMKAINGVKTLGDMLEELGGNEEKNLSVLRTVFLAEQSGLIVLGEDPLLRKEEAEAAQLEEIQKQMKRQNYFEIFGVTFQVSDDDLRAKYTDFAKKYHPDKLRAEAHPSLLEGRRSLFATISEAFNAIETEDQRSKYQMDLESGAIATAADVEKIQNTLHAETLFKKAEVLVRVRKYQEAMELLTEAISMNAEDIEFRIYRAYVGYLLAAKTGSDPEAADGAIKRILKLLNNNANIASGYLFLGHLYKVVGKNNVAVKYYEKVLEYDETNQEAMREVRLANMRKQKGKKKRRFF